jgi:hypothetical protein
MLTAQQRVRRRRVDPWPDAFRAALDAMAVGPKTDPGCRWQWLGPVENWLTQTPPERATSLWAAVASDKVASGSAVAVLA